ncbi:MAG: hypothetical protein AAGF89_08675 [Bacteroidota bacterium]
MGHRLLNLVIILLLLPFTHNCSQEQRDHGREAEKAYANLLYALHTDDQAGAVAAVELLDRRLDELRTQRFFPLQEERKDNLLYLFSHADQDYARARKNIKAGNLEFARYDLEEAVSAVLATNLISIRESYLGTIHDFLVSWQEAYQVIQDPTRCGLDATAQRRLFRELRNNWQQIRYVDISPVLYTETDIDHAAFLTKRTALTAALAKFLPLLKKEEIVGDLSVAVEQVDERVWGLVLLFGEPEFGVLRAK